MALAVLAHRLGAGWVGVLIDAGVALSFFAAFFVDQCGGADRLYVRAAGRAACVDSHAHERNATPHVAVALITALALATAGVHRAAPRCSIIWLSQFDRDVRLAACVRAGGDRRAALSAPAAPAARAACGDQRRGGRAARGRQRVSGAGGRLCVAALFVIAGDRAGWFLVLRVRFPERLRELEAELLTK